MQPLLTVLVVALTVTPVIAASIDMGTLTPTLTYPEPAPAPAPVTKDKAGINQ